jgi:hypothetical protein
VKTAEIQSKPQNGTGMASFSLTGNMWVYVRIQCFLAKVVSKYLLCWHVNGHVNQWHRIEDPEISVQRYSHQIIDKSAIVYNVKKETSFQKSVLGRLDVHMKQSETISLSLTL